MLSFICSSQITKEKTKTTGENKTTQQKQKQTKQTIYKYPNKHKYAHKQ